MNLEPQLLPISRPASDFIVEHLADEVLVYDQVHHVAHCLTRSAALVWARCDGKTSLEGAQADLRTSGSEEAIEGIVAQLVAARLVAAPAPQSVSRPRRQVNRSRRAFFSKGAVVAGAVLASPVIYSIVAPSVAQASSACGALGQQCCAPGNSCNAPLSCSGGTCQ